MGSTAATKRLMQELRELHNDPSDQFVASPMETDILEWHFTIVGPPDTAFAGGRYHGRIILPPEYPFKPPNIVLLTPNGRWETNKKICLSISAHHPELWQPAWGIRTILSALISFMTTPAEGALHAIDYPDEERVAMAKKSMEWKCAKCGVCMKDIVLAERRGSVAEEVKAETGPVPIVVQPLNDQSLTEAETAAAPAEQTAATTTTTTSEAVAAAAPVVPVAAAAAAPASPAPAATAAPAAAAPSTPPAVASSSSSSASAPAPQQLTPEQVAAATAAAAEVRERMRLANQQRGVTDIKNSSLLNRNNPAVRRFLEAQEKKEQEKRELEEKRAKEAEAGAVAGPSSPPQPSAAPEPAHEAAAPAQPPQAQAQAQAQPQAQPQAEPQPQPQPQQAAPVPPAVDPLARALLQEEEGPKAGDPDDLLLLFFIFFNLLVIAGLIARRWHLAKAAEDGKP